MKHYLLLLLAGLAVQAQVDTGALRDPLIEPVSPGQNCVDGTSPVKEGTATLMRGGEKAGDEKKFTDGTFRICVSPAFGEGEKIYVKVAFKTGGTIKDSNKLEVGLSPTSTPTDALTPLSISAMKDGDKAVKGTAPVKDGVVRISINGVTVADPTDTAVKKKPLETKLSNGAFKIELPEALKVNQLVVVTMNIVSSDNRQETLRASKDVAAATEALEEPKFKINALRIQADQTVLAGTVTTAKDLEAHAQRVNIRIYAKTETAHEKNPYFESTADFGAINCGAQTQQHGVFCVKIDRAMGDGDLIKIFALVTELDKTKGTGEPTKAEVVVAPPSAYYNVSIFDLAEGDSELRGTMPADAEKVVLSIFRGRGPGYGTNVQLARLEATTDKNKREFVAQNLARFSEGQSVVAVAFDSKGKEIARSHAASVRPVRYNWGRVRADFSVGAVLGRENKGFSSPQPFVRFFSDQNWKPFRHCRGYAPEDKNADEATNFLLQNCPDLRHTDPTGALGRKLVRKRQMSKLQLRAFNRPAQTDQSSTLAVTSERVGWRNASEDDNQPEEPAQQSSPSPVMAQAPQDQKGRSCCDGLFSRLGAVEKKIGSLATSADLQKEAGSIRTQLSNVAMKSDLRGLDGALSAIDKRLAKIEKKLEEQPDQPDNQEKESQEEKRLREKIEENLRLRRLSHWMINTYQIVDLTQTPRVSPVAAATPTTPAAPMTPAAASTAPLEYQITQSRNQLYFEGGLYVPFIPSMFQWTFQGLDNALYIAPIAKAGFMTVDNADGNSDQAGVYKFMGAGGRIGHMEIKNEPGNAPDSIFWVDTVFGRYDVYRQRTVGVDNEKFHNRIDVSGYFKIPASPFFFTFGGNFATNPRDRVKSDARFAFGARIDITRIFGQMIPTLKR
jgi:hypothetical protein